MSAFFIGLVTYIAPALFPSVEQAQNYEAALCEGAAVSWVETIEDQEDGSTQGYAVVCQWHYCTTDCGIDD